MRHERVIKNVIRATHMCQSVVKYFNVTYQHWFGRTEKNHERYRKEYPATGIGLSWNTSPAPFKLFATLLCGVKRH
jgi:hypothetical protein